MHAGTWKHSYCAIAIYCHIHIMGAMQCVLVFNNYSEMFDEVLILRGVGSFKLLIRLINEVVHPRKYPLLTILWYVQYTCIE